jgi:CheY-like chemotaxis protein
MTGEWAVLLVEDNPGDTYLVERAFEAADSHARVVEARDGTEALRMVNEVSPDMVLLDLRLPDFSGLDLLALLKARPVRGGFPIVVLTSSADETDRRAALDGGADRFITKPSTFDELVRVVKELTGRFRPRARTRSVK